MVSLKKRPEKAYIEPCEAGYRVRPENPEAMPLLVRLFGNEEAIRETVICYPIDAFKKNLSSVGKQPQISVSVQFCGNIASAPTILLRDLKAEISAEIQCGVTLTSRWELKIQECYGNTTGTHYQLAALRPEGDMAWWPMSQIPFSLSKKIGLSDRYGFDSQEKELFDLMTGKKDNGLINGMPVVVSEAHRDNMSHKGRFIVCTINLPEGVPASRNYIDCIETETDLKWGCFFPDVFSWEDFGYGHIAHAIDSLLPGQKLIIYSSPWKEIRFGKAVIERSGRNKFTVEGFITFSWDSIDDLASTLGVYLTDDIELTDDPESDIKKALEDAGDDASGCHTVDCEEAFSEAIPFSCRTYEPGVDFDFSFVCKGSSTRVFELLSKQEDEGYRKDKDEWKVISEIYSKKQSSD